MQEEIYKNLSLEDLPGEVWKDVVGYEGLYQVSNLGRVKMLSRNVLANKSVRTIKEHIITQHISQKGYLYVCLWDNNKGKKVYVHKIVLSSFLRGKGIGEECNHLNENRTDNRLNNLEWCSHKYNINYGERTKKHSKSMKNHKSLSVPVIQLSLNNEYIAEYPSLREAGRVMNRSFTSIKECCKGRCKSAFGFKWMYKQIK